MNEEMTLAEQADLHCVHRTSDPKMFDKGHCCQAGVEYRQLAKVDELGDTGCFLRLPCFRGNYDEAKRRGEPLMECEHHRWKTPEEIAEEEKEAEEMIARTMATLPLCTEIKKQHKGKDWRGIEECPICGGKIHVSHAAYNGHVAMKCETENCVSFQE